YHRFMQLQQQISAERLAEKIGRTLPVIIDEVDEEEGAVGRSMADAPEIDGMVYLNGEFDVQPGDIVMVPPPPPPPPPLWGSVVREA
ncbi:30S ribosomal protein S12 methylthiotransferase RimO, partial [Vibrio alginolyticus]|nr:30S ribosomal protein S12 methylthiotransferase RimO [Vibrio alginolyticus]